MRASRTSSPTRPVATASVLLVLTVAAAACGGADRSRSGVSSMRREARVEGGNEHESGEDVARRGPEHEPERATTTAIRTGELRGDLRTRRWVAPRRKAVRPELKAPSALTEGTKGKVTADSVRQTMAPPRTAPTASSGFAGLDLAGWGAGWPPDTTGDVGPTHYIQAVNTSLAIFDKASGSRLAAFTFDSFFTAAGATGACTSTNQGDPTVVYDQYSGRWIVSDFAFSSYSGPFSQCLAVSKTADPVGGGWWTYRIAASATAMNDFPKMSVWPDGIYMTANMFQGNSFIGAKVWAIDRTPLLTGSPASVVSFQLGSQAVSLLAANARATSVPAGTPAYLLMLGSSSSIRLYRLSVNWATPTSSTLTGPTTISVPSFATPGSVSQPSPGEWLDAMADRLMNKVQYASVPYPSLWTLHTVKSNGVAAPRWYQIRVDGTSPTLAQRSTYQPDTTSRWMGSLAVDKLGDLAIGYSASSNSTYPGLRYAGRLATDPANTITEGERTLVSGTGAQRGGYNRWGDYSDLSLDPDGCRFWFTSEYYATTGSNWQTRIVSFRFPGCT